jgi:endonuclease V-like protein UPF0215 family
MTSPLSNVVGYDDAPFDRKHRGDVTLIGAVCSRTRLDGVLRGSVRKDGRNSTERMATLLGQSHFAEHVQAVLLQGIAVAGLNVVDIHGLADTLGMPVLVVARKQPNMPAMQRALKKTGRGWERKWNLLLAAGEMEPLRGVFVQRAGLSLAQARHLLAATTLHGKLPEPLRLAHLIAGGITTGVSRGRA